MKSIRRSRSRVTAALAAVGAAVLAAALTVPVQAHADDPSTLTYTIVGDGQSSSGYQPQYQLGDDGTTVLDEVTGLTWMRGPTLSGRAPTASDKVVADRSSDFVQRANTTRYGGHNDWRLPTIKELYSLITFTGVDPGECNTNSACPNKRPFIDTRYFNFSYGEAAAGERIIDAQYLSATVSAADQDKHYGVNLADGRIKGYDRIGRGHKETRFYVQLVRGSREYGRNRFVRDPHVPDVVKDAASGLEWTQSDSGQALDWASAVQLADLANAKQYGDHDDWRLPDAKELESIVDYTRGPDASARSAAIDPVFSATPIINEGGQQDWAGYWTSTQHLGIAPWGSVSMVYVSFGRSLGKMGGRWIDNAPGAPHPMNARPRLMHGA